MWVQGVGITLDKNMVKANTWKSETKTTNDNNNNNNLQVFSYRCGFPKVTKRLHQGHIHFKS